jgi:hypothetical protein
LSNIGINARMRKLLGAEPKEAKPNCRLVPEKVVRGIDRVDNLEFFTIEEIQNGLHLKRPN